jgi:hypothetical protein
MLALINSPTSKSKRNVRALQRFGLRREMNGADGGKTVTI